MDVAKAQRARKDYTVAALRDLASCGKCIESFMDVAKAQELKDYTVAALRYFASLREMY